MKIGFTAGAFDLVHAGHILMFKECKTVCDYLIIGLHTNPNLDRPLKNKPIQSVLERQIILQSCKYIDEVLLYDTEKDLEGLLKTLPINVRILDQDYEHKLFTGKQFCIDNGIELYYNKRLHDYSSSELRNRIIKTLNE